MIPIFRKARKKIVENNKSMNYIKYAIGEILLVVIGITIAFQVNSWNETRKEKILEIKTLKELRSDLAQNLSSINWHIETFNNCIKSNRIIIDIIENQTPYNDSLNIHFSRLYPYTNFIPNETTYESLKQMGLNLVSNDSLRMSISDLYANLFALYRKVEDTYLIEHYSNYFKPMFISEFTSFIYNKSAQPINYNRFINNPHNKAILRGTVGAVETLLNRQNKLKSKVEKIMAQIDKEVGAVNL